MLSGLRVSIRGSFVFLIVFTTFIFAIGYYLYGRDSIKTDDRSVYKFKSDLLKEKLNSNPDDEQLELELALAQYLDGNSADSLKRFRSILRKNSLNTAALFYTGVINLDLKNYEEAVYNLEKVTILDPGFQPQLLYVNLGKAYFNSARYFKAIQNLKTAAGISPGSVEVNYYLGLSYQRIGQSEEARIALEKVVRIDADSEIGKEAKKVLKSFSLHSNS